VDKIVEEGSISVNNDLPTTISLSMTYTGTPTVMATPYCTSGEGVPNIYITNVSTTEFTIESSSDFVGTVYWKVFQF
tara:strand:- start:320 stop:550 length:231 start_codon:yes stop_codon:yes gene_type:complete